MSSERSTLLDACFPTFSSSTSHHSKGNRTVKDFFEGPQVPEPIFRLLRLWTMRYNSQHQSDSRHPAYCAVRERHTSKHIHNSHSGPGFPQYPSNLLNFIFGARIYLEQVFFDSTIRLWIELL